MTKYEQFEKNRINYCYILVNVENMMYNIKWFSLK